VCGDCNKIVPVVDNDDDICCCDIADTRTRIVLPVLEIRDMRY